MDYSRFKYSYYFKDGYYAGRPILISDIPSEHSSAAYCHIMQYDDSLIEHLDSGRKVTDYYSLRYSDYFPIDADCKDDIELARTQIVSFIETLNNLYDLEIQNLRFFFSGSKGFHVLFPSKLFSITPDRQLESKFKMLASKLISGLEIEKHGIVDSRIYSRNRLLRLPNSIHPKSRLYKIPITWKEISTRSASEIIAMAQSPLCIDTDIPISEVSPNQLLSDLYQECLLHATTTSSIDLGSALQSGVNDGNRHNQAFEITREFRNQGYTPDQAFLKIDNWNGMNMPPIKENSFPQSLIRSVYNHKEPLRNDSIAPKLRSTMRNHQIFRTKLFSHAEFRCAVALLMHTNEQTKIWHGVTVSPGQVIISFKSLGEKAQPSNPINQAVARKTIDKLKDAGVLKKVEQLSENRGVLYEWQDEFFQIFQQSSTHPSGSVPWVTPSDPATRSITVIYDDSLENLVTPIDQLIMSSTKNFSPFISLSEAI